LSESISVINATFSAGAGSLLLEAFDSNCVVCSGAGKKDLFP
jgi:hypothetical protein